MALDPINSMWIGRSLSRLELLTITSFLAHGHAFNLWLYEELESDIPREVNLLDAASILPRDAVFTRLFEDPIRKLGKGSVASPFSDLFRYKLLHGIGGWWVDMDVTCLRPLRFEEPYVFRPHLESGIVANVVKAPRGSAAMLEAFELANSCSGSETVDWLLPNRILYATLCSFGLRKYVREGFCNMDLWDEVELFMSEELTFDPSWYVFHWCHEKWRVNGIDKNSPPRGGSLESLMKCYGVL